MSVRLISALCAALIATAVPAANPAVADEYRYGHGQSQGNGHGKHHRHRDRHEEKRGGYGRPAVAWQHGYHGHRAAGPVYAYPVVRYYHYRPLPRHHHHKKVYVHKRRGDNDLLYAILALQIVDLLNDSQRDNYGWAQNRAVSAPLGETIRWNDSGASGSVTATRDGIDDGGRYCREFQHDITVGNRMEQGYGVACRQPDGSWQIVS
ncbi:hypothetical protein [Pelagibius sp. 7325]|uniref:hypothetical protein n=1 Tax=Pelagibius sp. 7325 TaxID=3131994 RepID=UPI0030EE4E9C